MPNRHTPPPPPPATSHEVEGYSGGRRSEIPTFGRLHNLFPFLSVRFVVERALREIPKKLIQKREDKLLDYYNALKNSAAVSSQSVMKKIDYFVKSVSDKKKEYEALSVQLRQKIPSIINSMTRVSINILPYNSFPL